MPEATVESVNDEQIITCGHYRLKGDVLYELNVAMRWIKSADLDDLYAVLHARHVAQHYNAELMARIEKAVEAVKDDDLYGGEG